MSKQFHFQIPLAGEHFFVDLPQFMSYLNKSHKGVISNYSPVVRSSFLITVLDINDSKSVFGTTHSVCLYLYQ